MIEEGFLVMLEESRLKERGLSYSRVGESIGFPPPLDPIPTFIPNVNLGIHLFLLLILLYVCLVVPLLLLANLDQTETEVEILQNPCHLRLCGLTTKLVRICLGSTQH